jgi:hypothetical protein
MIQGFAKQDEVLERGPVGKGFRMEPQLGWTLLSRDALRRAQMHLREESEGVRDEIGFLSLHQAYADRFFPGTSVLHTRLRYALFVPWLYLRLIERGERSQVVAALEKEEVILAGRLKRTDEKGVIGRDAYPQPTAQPPSMVYWTALAAWRILRSYADGSYPPRSKVHRMIARGHYQTHLYDDDKQLLDEEELIFAKLPKPPKEWTDPTLVLNFHLTPEERDYLRGCLLAVNRPGGTNVPSLLSRLVEHGVDVPAGLSLWGTTIRAVADRDDQSALIRAGRVAALSAIGRGVYAALVEGMRDAYDKAPTEDIHRANLEKVVAEHSRNALQLNIEELQEDVPTLTQSILDVLCETKTWVERGERDPKPLFGVYERAEARRKKGRARLTQSLAGRQKRLEWQAKKHTLAQPLHYRWDNVQRLLMDLGGQS